MALQEIRKLPRPPAMLQPHGSGLHSRLESSLTSESCAWESSGAPWRPTLSSTVSIRCCTPSAVLLHLGLSLLAGLPLPEIVRADMADLMMRKGVDEVFDALVTDPPYGVRAGVRQSSDAAAAAPRRPSRCTPFAAARAAAGDSDIAALPAVSHNLPRQSAAPASTSEGGGGEATGTTRQSFPRTRVAAGDTVLLDLVDLAARMLRVGECIHCAPIMIEIDASTLLAPLHCRWPPHFSLCVHY